MGVIYQVPPDTKDKEKVVGGIMTAKQAAFIGVGIALFAVVILVIVAATKNIVLALVLGFPFLLSGLPFAFYKKDGYPLIEYIRLKRRFRKKSKMLINRRMY